MHPRRRFLSAVLALAFASSLAADPLTKEQEIDFGRDVASRNLKGLATRSDGRILPGPVFTDLNGPKLGEILWTLKSSGKNRFLVGTGPNGKVQEVAFNPKDNSYTAKEIADVEETQVMSLLPLADDVVLLGTSPTAAIYVLRDGKIVARVPLPADSVFDFLALPDGSVLAATGNPGKIFRLDVKKLTKAGIIAGKAEDDTHLAERGIALFGEVRDRNVRKLARLTDGRIVAGSSPKGNVYSFAAAGGAPLFLQENRDAEVVDLLPTEDGGFYAGIVFNGGDGQRIARGGEAKDETRDRDRDRDTPKPTFPGRSTVVRFSADSFPETVLSKGGLSLYRVVKHDDWLLLTAGEQGDAFGYDPAARRSLTFAGSASSQLSDVATLGDGRFLLLRNNAPGLAVLAFSPASQRELETKRIDLGQASELGALRFSRLRGLDFSALKVEASTNYGADELEGWSPWTELKLRDDAFQADGLRGRYVRYKLSLAGKSADFQIDKATQYHLPQNRRPSLSDFRIFPPNQGIIPVPEPPPSAVATLGQMLFPNQRDRDNKDDAPDRRKGSFLNSQVVPAPGTQIVYWVVNDSDGDGLAYTFSIRAEKSEEWTDLAVRTTESFVQFETSALPEGLYLTRLTVTEQAPRPAAQRLSYTFETDNLLVDHTAPTITAVDAKRASGNLVISVTGRDALSMLDGAEFSLNNGTHEIVTHPADGVLDGREETFTIEIPDVKTSNATSVEIILYDQSSNATTVRVPVK